MFGCNFQNNLLVCSCGEDDAMVMGEDVDKGRDVSESFGKVIDEGAKEDVNEVVVDQNVFF